MPTYTYQTIPSDTSEEPKRFDVFQRMTDPELEFEPKTGIPVRRVITGGVGLKIPGLRRSTVVNKASPAATACGCATGKPHSH